MMDFKKFSFIKHYNYNGFEKDLISGYTSGGYHHSMSPALEDLIKKHKTPRKITVWVGLSEGARNDFLDRLDKKSFTPSRVLSTSLNKEQALTFSHSDWDGNYHMLKLNVPKHSHGAYLEHASERPQEEEFLLSRNIKIKLRNKPTSYKWSTKNMIEWQGELIHDGTKEIKSK